jgi:excisionase family DNA binding protein
MVMGVSRDERRVITVREAARLAGLDVRSIYTQCTAGTIPHVRIGRRVLIPKKAFLDMLDGKANAA